MKNIRNFSITAHVDHGKSTLADRFIQLCGGLSDREMRSLTACEGARLVVDAAQGVEAQSVANCYTAIEQGLEVLLVLNKIDLPAAGPARVAHEIKVMSTGRVFQVDKVGLFTLKPTDRLQ